MAIPEFEALTLPLLAIAAEGEAFAVADAAATLADEFDLSAEERSHLLPSRGQTSFENRVQWAKTFLVKAGLLEAAGNGRFVITARGKAVAANPPQRIDLTYLRQFSEFSFVRSFDETADGGGTSVAASAIPDETILAAYVQIEDGLAEELLDRLRSGPPAVFEKAVLRVLNVMMCQDSSRIDLDQALASRGVDGDIAAVIDREPLGREPLYVQTRKYGDGRPLGPDAVRDFLAAFEKKGASEGVFAAASSFTAQARDAALAQGKHVMLIDRSQLARLMILYCVGCRVERTLEIKGVFEEFFA